MASAEYIELRKQTLSAASSMDNASPCQAGMGNCCVMGVTISQEEFGILQDAFSHSELSSEVIEAAKANTGDIRREACVFLDDATHLCKIYPYRPLECIDFGRGALPKTAQGWEKCQSATRNCPEQFLESSDGLCSPDIAQRLCRECQMHASPDQEFPLQVIVPSFVVGRYYREQVGNMRLDRAAVLLHQSITGDKGV